MYLSSQGYCTTVVVLPHLSRETLSDLSPCVQEKQIMTELSIKLIDGSLMEGSTVRVGVDEAKNCLTYDVEAGILKKRRVED